MTYRDRIEISFDAGHRLLDYHGKCSSPHGHTFRAELIVSGPVLNSLGLLLDFGDVKGSVKQWIDRNWDHAFLVNSQDVEMLAGLALVAEAKVYRFEAKNPSAETMACELFGVASCELGTALEAARIWESTTQYAEFSRSSEP